MKQISDPKVITDYFLGGMETAAKRRQIFIKTNNYDDFKSFRQAVIYSRDEAIRANLGDVGEITDENCFLKYGMLLDIVAKVI